VIAAVLLVMGLMVMVVLAGGLVVAGRLGSGGRGLNVYEKVQIH
jgi:hypothetical protein